MKFFALLVLSLSVPCNSVAHDHHEHAKPAEKTATKTVASNKNVWFVAPVPAADGSEVKVPRKLEVKMDVKGMLLHPAGKHVEKTGHHHLLIDGQPISAGQVVPKDDKHLHFGDAQAATTIELSPGSHTLTLQFADGLHRSYGPEWSATIKVNAQ